MKSKKSRIFKTDGNAPLFLQIPVKTRDDFIDFIDTLGSWNNRASQLASFLKRTKTENRKVTKEEFEAMKSLLRDISIKIYDYITLKEDRIKQVKTKTENKQINKEDEQRRIYTESLSRAIQTRWKHIGDRRVQEVSRKGDQEQEGNQGRNTQRSGRVLEDVVKEANEVLEEELNRKGIAATKQKIRVATSEEFHKAISEEKKQNKHGYMVDVHNHIPDQFEGSNFAYDADTNTLQCPAGQKLHAIRTSSTTEYGVPKNTTPNSKND